MNTLVAVLGAGFAACGGGEESAGSGAPTGARGAAWFEEVASEAGIDFVHVRAAETRYWFPEIMGAGLAFLDHDLDGDVDLYCVQSGDLASEGGEANRLFENDGSGHFRDVTGAAGVGDLGYGMGCAVGDFDADGDPDLYVTNVGPNVLYRNEGDGRFSDVTAAAGVGDPGWGTSCGFVDFDGDGFLDLFVANYVRWSPEIEVECAVKARGRDYCHPNNYNAPAGDKLYRNRGDGTFEDVTGPAGIGGAVGNGLGVAFGDFDGNGHADIYVANDLMANRLWMNQGDGTFVDRALLAGCAVNMQGSTEAGMGVAAVDVDQDADLDLFMTHLGDETNTLYVNDKGLFTDRTTSSGLAVPSVKFTGFGMGFADFDHDGRLDLYVANGRVGLRTPVHDPGDPYAEPDQVFRGVEGGRFEEVVGPGEGVVRARNARGAAFADIDGDGDVDVALNDNDSALRLLRNVAADGRGAAAWIAFDVHDARGAVAIGARVALEADGRTGWRSVDTAYSYCSANSPRVHFGLGDGPAPDGVRVLWPDGVSEDFGALAPGRVHRLERGAGR